MDILRKWILLVGIFLCGTVLCVPCIDRAVPIRNIIWCVTTIALLLCSQEIKIGKIHFFALGYFIFSLLSYFAAVNKGEWLYTTLRVALVILFLSVIDIDHKSLAKLMIVLGVVFIISFWIDRYRVGSFYHCRGLMRQRNTWAASQFFILPFCYYAFTKGFWKKFSFVTAALLVTNIVLLNARSSILAILISSAVLVPKKKLFLILFAGFVILVSLKVTVFRTTGYGPVTDSMHHRLEQWKPTLRMIKDRPIGVGAGNWKIEFPKYAKGIDYPGAFVNETFRFPHNDFLWVWSEVGSGILFYIGMFVYSLFSGKKYLKAGLIGYMVIAFFGAPTDRTFPLVAMTLFIAMSCKREPVHQSKILLTVLVFMLVVFGFRLRASYWNKILGRAKTPEQILKAVKGESPFSTLTYMNYPWCWWEAKANYKLRNPICVSQYRKALEYNPYDVYVLYGVGVSYTVESDVSHAIEYFEKASESCPEYEAPKKMLEVLRKSQNVNDRKRR